MAEWGCQVNFLGVGTSLGREQTMEEALDDFRGLLNPWYARLTGLPTSPWNVKGVLHGLVAMDSAELNGFFGNMESDDMKLLATRLVSKDGPRLSEETKKQFFQSMASKLDAQYLVDLTKAIKETKDPSSFATMLELGDAIVTTAPFDEKISYVLQMKDRVKKLDLLVASSDDESHFVPSPEATILMRLLSEHADNYLDSTWYPRMLESVKGPVLERILVAAYGQERRDGLLWREDRFKTEGVQRLVETAATIGYLDTRRGYLGSTLLYLDNTCNLLHKIEAMNKSFSGRPEVASGVEQSIAAGRSQMAEHVANLTKFGFPAPQACVLHLTDNKQ